MNMPLASREIDAVVELRKVGNSVGVIFPRELLAQLGLDLGDRLFISPRPGGGFEASRTDPDFESGMEAARRAIEKYKNALAELAK